MDRPHLKSRGTGTQPLSVFVRTSLIAFVVLALAGMAVLLTNVAFARPPEQSPPAESGPGRDEQEPGQERHGPQRPQHAPSTTSATRSVPEG